MNYKSINTNIVNKKKIENLSTEEAKYLEDNSVLYYAAKNLLTNNQQKESILQNAKSKITEYSDTLKLLSNNLEESGIPFILFKTHKYIDEIVDGDIDIIVRAEDLDIVGGKLSAQGFNCSIENRKKIECTKIGYSKIEPRVDITHHGYCLLKSDVIWQNFEINNNVKKSTREIDAIAIILNFLYGPKYLKLYDYLLLTNSNWKRIKEIAKENNFIFEIELVESLIINKSNMNKRFPIFLSEGIALKFWFSKILNNKNISFVKKLKHLIFWFYIKYKYKFLGKLHFAHNWNGNK